MSVEIRVPQLPESVADATLVAWRKQAGQSVDRDENLADLETDKVMLEVPAPVSGVLREIKVTDGSTVKSGDVLAIIEEGDAAVAKSGPAARRVIEENALPPGSIAGSASGGRVTKADAVRAAAAAPVKPAAPAKAQAAAPAAASPPVPVSSPATAEVPPAGVVPRSGRAEQRVPMTRLRARIAERLLQAQASAALLTTFNEVDLGAVQELRARYKESFEAKYGVKLGFMSFFVKAVVEGLKRFPLVNASVENNDIIYHEYFDIGVAVSTDRGLMVPVLRDVDALSFAAIEQGIAQFASRARSGSITLEDLTGGTFSITNGGTFGSLMSTPIVNAPQSAILGMHKIQDRAMVVKGQILVRPMMYVALTYDHRIIDGREAVQFLVAVKDYLEDPSRLLLGI
ncbi:MAG: 2-oxoglutarate dehydrogenase complex dihydrolipoyllysine-residue succinyltransferase [Steroidobacteraceae bacterium]